jgi:ABC-2 type transport system ATP-binding protein
MNKIIEVKDLVKNYGSFEAVKGISFDVYEGEIFGLLGPNGAGKSTTLEIIETLRQKTSGRIIVDGIDLDEHPNEIKKVIGVQLQTSGYYPNLTLVELIELFAGLYNTEVNAKEVLRSVNLTLSEEEEARLKDKSLSRDERKSILERDKSKAKFKELSGGQKQRFSIATTLIHRPKIIFLDEPTTGLDPQARRNLWQLIQQIRDGGTTVIITTHYMDEAEILCNRVAIVDAGRIIALNSPDQLIDQLIAQGFHGKKQVKQANLEDVFIQLTGHEMQQE